MFTKPTVFILGAGASWHYGYPTGETLVKRVIAEAEAAANKFSYKNEGSLIHFWPNYICTKENLPKDFEDISTRLYAISKFSSECTDLATRLKQVNPLVIDYFLGHNPKLREIGKLFISKILLDCERKFAKSGNINRLDHNERVDNPDDWARFILHKMMDRCDLKSLPQNKVNFISFNYDLSLENALYKGLMSVESFQDETVVRNFINPNRFIHMYGQIRDPQESYSPAAAPNNNPHDPNTKKHVYYNEQILFDTAYEAAKGIKTIDSIDKDDNEKGFKNAQKIIEDAHSIYVLGYGFDERNSERLNFSSFSKQNTRNRRVYFTNFQDRNQINKRAGEAFLQRRDGFLPPKTFLQENSSTFVLFEKSSRNVYDALAWDFDI